MPRCYKQGTKSVQLTSGQESVKRRLGSRGEMNASQLRVSSVREAVKRRLYMWYLEFVIQWDCYSSCVKIRCQETASWDCNSVVTSREGLSGHWIESPIQTPSIATHIYMTIRFDRLWGMRFRNSVLNSQVLEVGTPRHMGETGKKESVVHALIQWVEPSELSRVLTLLTFIREMLGSNLRWDADCHDNIRGAPQSV
jgi:hypothetical protein